MNKNIRRSIVIAAGVTGAWSHGVVGQVAPFAGGLTWTVESADGPVFGTAVTGVEGVAASVAPSYLQNGARGTYTPYSI